MSFTFPHPPSRPLQHTGREMISENVQSLFQGFNRKKEPSFVVTLKEIGYISNHWSFPDKEGETFSMEIFHSFSTIFPQFFHTERSGVWKFCGKRVENRNGKLFPWSIRKTEVGYRFIY